MVHDKVTDYFGSIAVTGRMSENNPVFIGKQTVKFRRFYRKRLIACIKTTDKFLNTMFGISCSAEI